VKTNDKDILEEEYNKAEVLMQKLKNDVSEMEITLKQERLKNIAMKENDLINKRLILEEEEKTRAYKEKLSKEIEAEKDRRDYNLKIIENLIESLTIKAKQRKMIQVKILSLEHTIKAAESFILSLDKFFSSAIQGKQRGNKEELLDGVVRDAKFNEIVRQKELHKAILVGFRNAYEENLKAERRIQAAQDKYLVALKSVNLEGQLLSKLNDKHLAILRQFSLVK
jgi:hypothetical protein